jgi:hypothetical protein
MYQTYSTTTLLARIKDLEMENAELSVSHLGILSPAAIRRSLRLMAGPVDLICLDFRKLHDLNDILGYDVANVYYGRFARTRQHDETGRMADTRGQWGGDELVIACALGTGLGLLSRLVSALDELTGELTSEQRAAMFERTGGLIDGFAATFVLIEQSLHPLIDAARGITRCGELKKGNVTGCRSTSGKPGTIIGSFAPLAATEPEPLPPPPWPSELGDTEGDEEDPGEWRQPRAVTLTSIAIESRIFICGYCKGIHHVQTCPALRAALFAPVWTGVELGRGLCQMLWCNHAGFVELLTSATPARLREYAESYIAFLRDYRPDCDVTVFEVLDKWSAIISRGGDRGPAGMAMQVAA